MDESYNQDLAIDPHMLDEEWLRQSGLFMKYSILAAEAQRARDQAKEKVDVVRAELDRAIRVSSPEILKTKYQMEKITETAISSCIILQPEYKKVSDELIAVNFELNVLQSAVRAFDHKRAALENEVKLWLGSYFSGPKEPRDIPGGKRIVDVARDRVAGKMREEINRKSSASRPEELSTQEVAVEESLEKQRDLVRSRRRRE